MHTKASSRLPAASPSLEGVEQGQGIVPVLTKTRKPPRLPHKVPRKAAEKQTWLINHNPNDSANLLPLGQGLRGPVSRFSPDYPGGVFNPNV